MSSHTPFNLITDFWLPVRRRSGARAIIRPAELADTSDDPIVAFEWGRADFDAAARELLIGLLALAYAGEEDECFVEGFRTPPGAQALDARLAPYCDAFNLDGDGQRFLQDLEELDGERVPSASLLIDAPGGNTIKENKDLFQKRGNVEVLSRPAAAMALYTLQAFAPSGGAGHRTSLRGGGPLTTIVRPGRARPGLWPMLLLNTPPNPRPGAAERARVFPWCGSTRTSQRDPRDAASTNFGDIHPLQMLFGMPRRIRLIFQENQDKVACDLTGRTDKFIVRAYRTRPWGVNYGPFVHPFTPYSRQKATDVAWLPIHPQPGGITYRHWPDIALGESMLRKRAASITTAEGRISPADGPLRVLASGYEMDNMKARAFVEAEMPLFALGNRQSKLEETARQMVEVATDAADALARRVRDAMYDRKTDLKSSRFGVLKERFYTATEAPFYAAVEKLAEALQSADPDAVDISDPFKEQWLRTLRPYVERLFDEEVQLERLDDRLLERAVAARLWLVLMMRGKGKEGARLLKKLGLSQPAEETKMRKTKRRASA